MAKCIMRKGRLRNWRPSCSNRAARARGTGIMDIHYTGLESIQYVRSATVAIAIECYMMTPLE